MSQDLSSDFRPSTYLKPKTDEELSEILRTMGPKARILAGGTGIYELAGRGLLSDVEALVDISDLGWAYVKKSAQSFRIGSATTMTELMTSADLGMRNLGALVDALRAIQPVQVKNVATVGGAICTGLPFFDLPTALAALDATVQIGPTGRTVKLLDFIQGFFSMDLGSHEFVREVEIPIGKDARASAFQKFALTSDDWAMINCGASLSLDKGGRIKEPRLVFGGGVGGKPARASRSEKALEGLKAREEDVKGALEEELPHEITTETDIRSSAQYRFELAKVIGRRTVMAACERAR